MYYHLLVFLDPEENYEVLGYQTFLSDKVLKPSDVTTDKKKMEIKVTGYTPDSAPSESKYARFGTLIYDNNVLTIKFSDETDDVYETIVEAAFVSQPSPMQIDLEISKILSEKRNAFFQLIGFFDEDQEFSILGYHTYYGIIKDPENDVEFNGNEWIISLDNFREDDLQWQSKYQRLCCHYDPVEKKLHITLPGTMENVNCRIFGYNQQEIQNMNIDLELQVMQTESVRMHEIDNISCDLLAYGLLLSML